MTAPTQIKNAHEPYSVPYYDLEVGGVRLSDLTPNNSVAATAAFADEAIVDIFAATGDVAIAIGPDVTGLTAATGYTLKSGNRIQALVRKGSKVGAFAGTSQTVQIMPLGI